MSTSTALATVASDAAGPVSVSHVCTKSAWEFIHLRVMPPAWWYSSCHPAGSVFLLV